MRHVIVILVCALVGGLGLVAAAEPYEVGSVLPSLELPDPHGEAHTLEASTRVVLFSRDMDGGGVIQEALSEDGAALLERQGAVYIADVSRMPGFVRRFIAKPRMRKRPYPLWIDEEGEVTADFPSLPERPTLLFLESLRVVRVEHPATPAELLEALGETQAP